MAISPDGKMVVSGSRDGTIRRWDVATGARVGQALCGHKDQSNPSISRAMGLGLCPVDGTELFVSGIRRPEILLDAVSLATPTSWLRLATLSMALTSSPARGITEFESGIQPPAKELVRLRMCIPIASCVWRSPAMGPKSCQVRWTILSGCGMPLQEIPSVKLSEIPRQTRRMDIDRWSLV